MNRNYRQSVKPLNRSVKKFAVFDIDGTLYRGNLTWDFFKQLAKNGAISQQFLDLIMPLYDTHDKREVEDAYHIFDASFITILAKSVNTIEDLKQYWATGEHVGAQGASRLYTYTRDLLLDLRSKGYILIAITHSIGSVARPFAKQLGFDIVICSDEIVDSRNKRVVTYNAIQLPLTKGVALQKLVSKYSLSYGHSIAVGDTLTDASILELVDNPIVFNPDKRLRNVAVTKRWPIIIERKDTIYHLDPNGQGHQVVFLR